MYNSTLGTCIGPDSFRLEPGPDDVRNRMSSMLAMSGRYRQLATAELPPSGDTTDSSEEEREANREDDKADLLDLRAVFEQNSSMLPTSHILAALNKKALQAAQKEELAAETRHVGARKGGQRRSRHLHAPKEPDDRIRAGGLDSMAAVAQVLAERRRMDANAFISQMFEVESISSKFADRSSTPQQAASSAGGLCGPPVGTASAVLARLGWERMQAAPIVATIDKALRVAAPARPSDGLLPVRTAAGPGSSRHETAATKATGVAAVPSSVGGGGAASDERGDSDATLEYAKHTASTSGSTSMPITHAPNNSSGHGNAADIGHKTNSIVSASSGNNGGISREASRQPQGIGAARTMDERMEGSRSNALDLSGFSPHIVNRCQKIVERNRKRIEATRDHGHLMFVERQPPAWGAEANVMLNPLCLSLFLSKRKRRMRLMVVGEDVLLALLLTIGQLDSEVKPCTVLLRQTNLPDRRRNRCFDVAVRTYTTWITNDDGVPAELVQPADSSYQSIFDALSAPLTTFLGIPYTYIPPNAAAAIQGIDALTQIDTLLQGLSCELCLSIKSTCTNITAADDGLLLPKLFHAVTTAPELVLSQVQQLEITCITLRLPV